MMDNLKDTLYDMMNGFGLTMEQIDYDILSEEEKMSSLYSSINYIYEIMRDTIVPQHDTITSKSKKDKIIGNLFLRIYCQIKSLIKLNEITDFQCMSFVARSVVELLLDMILISRDLIDNQIEKYYSFQDVKIFKISKNQSLMGYIDDVLSYKNNPALKFYNDNINRIDQLAKNIWGTDKNNRPIFPDHWSGIDLYSRLEKIKNEDDIFTNLKRFYFNLVPYSNMYIHADPSGILHKSEEFFHTYVYNIFFNLHEVICFIIDYYGQYFKIHKIIPQYSIMIENHCCPVKNETKKTVIFHGCRVVSNHRNK